jgi:rare lipoprotein A
LWPQRVHLAIPCIVALASIVVPMGESLAAVRKPHAAEATIRPHRHAPAHATASSRRSREAGSAGSRCKVTHRYTRRQRQPLRASERSIAHRHRGIVLAARDKSDGARSFSGFASYFSEPQRLATGETYDPSALICAHRTLPLGTKLRVSNPKTGRSVVVTVKDRGPFVHGRVLDLSVSAARALGMIGHGVMLVSASVM